MSPLIQKLGLKPDMRALLLAAPDGYLQRLPPLPEGVEIVTRPVGTYLALHVRDRSKA